MSNIWDLPPEAIEEARKHGYTDEQIEVAIAARRANYNAIRESILEGFEVTEEELVTYYQDRYGIDHACHCAEDKFLNHATRITDCTAELHDKLIEKLQEVLPERDYLASEVARLRQRVIELGGSYDEDQ